jgi:hypothetical protein
MEIENDKLIEIYFKKCYVGFGEPTIEETEYLYEHTFKCVVTDQTKNNGWDSDKEHVKNLLIIGKEYTLTDMNVSQSSSTLRLEEFPNESFNTVNFEIYKYPLNEQS